MKESESTVKIDYSRRDFLKKASAASAGIAATGAVSGFPMVWANKLKDIELLHVGPSYSVIREIADRASEDLGFKIQVQTAWTDALLTRIANQPDTVDVADLEFWATKRIWQRGNLQPVAVREIDLWDKIYPIFSKGEYPNGAKVSTQGALPYEVQYAAGPGSKEIHAGPTDYATIIPTVYNADTLGIRPDLIGRPIESWAELLNPEFSGKTAILGIPAIGIMDAAMAVEARGDIRYGDKGNMTRAEIDQTVEIMKDLKSRGHFRAFWSSFDESVNLMASGEVVIQSMWSPAVTAVKTRGISCVYQEMKEGYRGWGNGMGLMAHLDGLKRDAAVAYLNWYLSGWQGAFIARQGYYSAVPETARKHLSEDEWGYWYEGRRANDNIVDPYGNLMGKAGEKRDGGAFAKRMGNIECWNTVMDENRYMVKKWNEFTAS